MNAVAVVVRRQRRRELLPALNGHNGSAPHHLQPRRSSIKKRKRTLNVPRAPGTHRVHEVRPQRRGQLGARALARLPVLFLEPSLDRGVVLGEHYVLDHRAQRLRVGVEALHCALALQTRAERWGHDRNRYGTCHTCTRTDHPLRNKTNWYRNKRSVAHQYKTVVEQKKCASVGPDPWRSRDTL